MPGAWPATWPLSSCGRPTLAERRADGIIAPSDRDGDRGTAEAETALGGRRVVVPQGHDHGLRRAERPGQVQAGRPGRRVGGPPAIDAHGILAFALGRVGNVSGEGVPYAASCETLSATAFGGSGRS